MGKVANSFYYEATPSRVWTMVTDFGALQKVCARFMKFEGLPEGRIIQGMNADVLVRLFGILPPQRQHMHLEICDDDAMFFQSRESGAGVGQWDHALQLSPEGSGTRLDETIEIDAGQMTPLYMLWARIMYRGRHKPRQELLQTGAF